VRALGNLVLLFLALVGVACGGSSGSPPRNAGQPTHEVDVGKPDADNAGASLMAGGTLRSGAPGATSAQVPVDANDPSWGSPTAPVTVVTFQDFQCPFCSRVHPTVRQLMQTYGPAKLRVVFKHNPLPFHQDALPAALAAQAVFQIAGPEAFFAYADQLFRGQRELTDANLLQWAADVGVDRSALLRMASSRELRAKIEADKALASAVGLNGTPSFLINGARLVGAQPYDKFKEIVDAELVATATLKQKGVADAELYPQRVAANYAAPPPPDSGPDEDQEPPNTIWKVPVGKSPAKGPATALVTMVEFSDYQCPFCKRAQSTVDELMKRYAGKLRVVFKHNPLPFHQRAMPAANFALEVRAEKGDKGFWLATQRLFEKNPNLEDDDLLAIARELKVNEFRVKNALAKLPFKNAIQDDVDLADDVTASGTPVFFINGRKLSGAQPIEKFSALIDQELAAAEARVKSGTRPAMVYAETIKDGKAGKPFELAPSVPSVSKDNPSRGAVKAAVTIQVFSDFQCPFCKRVLPTLEQVEKQYPGRVLIVWRNLPLPFHNDARPAAMAAMEAFAQKGNTGFWKMHELIYAGSGGLDRRTLEGYAAQIGLDTHKFSAAMDGASHEKQIQADEAAAKAAGISGTPGFVINGYHISGAQPFSKFKRVIERALDDAKHGRKAAP
jgi:protein-disulfide isomerase